MNVCVPLMRKFLWQYITLLNKEESDDDEEEDISHIWRKHILKHYDFFKSIGSGTEIF